MLRLSGTRFSRSAPRAGVDCLSPERREHLSWSMVPGFIFAISNLGDRLSPELII